MDFLVFQVFSYAAQNIMSATYKGVEGVVYPSFRHNGVSYVPEKWSHGPQTALQAVRQGQESGKANLAI